MISGTWLAALLILNAVPLLDLVQVSVVRLARGIPPWRGDRRHLAHRLAQIFPAPMVAVLLALLQILSVPVVLSSLRELTDR
jgi:UDP-N-acetylmuramyl pentapeptide phosphotransferase/UDP-N-acetylglucosamine-1-phosphate transferase